MTLELPRYCHLGISGPDVIAYSRTYRRIHLRERRPTRHFGTRMAASTVTFQHRHDLHADGVIGPHTFDLLKRHFDRYDVWLVKQAPHTLYHPRQLVVSIALEAYKHRPFPYRRVRPWERTLEALYRDGSDCSGTFHTFYWIGHTMDPSIPDPSGYGFNGNGNTESMLSHGRRVSTPRPGDAVFYYSDYGHVGMYLGNGRVFSHGKPGDPIIISTAYATMFRSYLP